MSALQTDHNLYLMQHAPLVERLARGMARRLPASVDPQDLVQDGYVGLLEAERRFDAARGAQLKTFASTRIRGSMVDSLRSQDWVSRHGRRRSRELARTEEELCQKLGRWPSRRDLSRQTGLTLDQVDLRRTESARTFVGSLDELKVGESGETPLEQSLADPSVDVAGAVTEEATRQELRAVVDKLPAREGQVVKWYYFGSAPIKEIACRLGVSEARVSQLHTRALRRLRELMAA